MNAKKKKKTFFPLPGTEPFSALPQLDSNPLERATDRWQAQKASAESTVDSRELDMITIQIEDSIRSLSSPKDIDENWINQQINRRKDDRRPVCVRVTIKDGSVNIMLTSADCTNTGGGDRPPNSKEQSIFDLWDRVGMKKKEFHGGNLVAFLKQLCNII